MPKITASQHRNIATIARQIAETFAATDWEWGDPVGRKLYQPEAADIALHLHSVIAGIKPGQTAESGRIQVEWPVDEDGPQDIRVFVHFGDFKVAEADKAGHAPTTEAPDVD